MAGRLLWVALAAGLVHGCLLPQDDQVILDLPPKKNTAPRLLFDTAFPAQHHAPALQLHPSCLAKERPFQIAVEDPDLGDTIESRWFVDPDDNFTTLPVNGTALPRATAPARGVVRPGLLFYTTGALLVPSSHSVTVVVADRQFMPEGIEVRRADLDLPDGGTVPEFTMTDRYTWEVTTDVTTTCVP